MAAYQKKFIVINKKHYDKLPARTKIDLDAILELVQTLCPEAKTNNYFVCNQDEPYADKIIDTILEGEDEKEKDEH